MQIQACIAAYLVQIVWPNKVEEMIKAVKYPAFCWSALLGHLDVLQYLANQALDLIDAMIEAENYFAFSAAAGKGHLGILKYLVQLAPHQVYSMIKASDTYTEEDYVAFRRAIDNKDYAIISFLLKLPKQTGIISFIISSPATSSQRLALRNIAASSSAHLPNAGAETCF